MPKPSKPTLTPYTEQLPDVSNPTTWAARTPPFWNWVTGPGFQNMDATVDYVDDAAAYIDTALDGSETVVSAVAGLQAKDNAITAYVRTLLDDTNAAAARVTLGAAPLASPALTGTPTAPTQAAGNNTTQLATTKFVKSEIPNALNASGSAPLYACRAWVNFNGSNGFIRGSGNVSSVTRNGVGDYTVNFATAMQDIDFAVAGSAGSNELLTPDDGRLFSEFGMAARTVSSCRVSTAVVSNSIDTTVLRDSLVVSVSIFR